MTNSGDDWDRRILCSDGDCIGIVGADGRCKVCGLPYDGQLTWPAADVDAVDSDPTGEADDLPADRQSTRQEDPGAGAESSAKPQASDDSWEDRTLCSDENCIGVIGPDGRCKVCGKPYSG